MAENTIFQQQDMDPLDQWAQQYWAALYNPIQTQQANIGQQLAAGPSAQQQQVQTQQVQQQQQQNTQQQAPASVPQGQTISQPQSNVGMVQKIGNAPANVPIEGMTQAPAESGSMQYQGELKPVYDEAGQVVQWAPESSTFTSAANDQGYDMWGGKRPGNWNLNLPDIQQGGLDQQAIDILGQLQNNPDFHGGRFNPEEWEEGPNWIPENFQGANEELGVKQAQGGDPTNNAGQMEQIGDVDQYALRNKVTGEVVPVSQLIRELPQDAAGINTKLAEFARSHPWWKYDLAPDVIKGISMAIATAAGGAGGAALGAAGGAAAGSTAAGLASAAGAGTGAALAQNAMMEGDIGDRLLPTALAFGGGAAMPYVSDFVGGLIPDSWKEAVSGLTSSTGGAEGAITGAEELGGALPTGAEEAGVNWDFGEPQAPMEEVTPFDQGLNDRWVTRGSGKFTEYPQSDEAFLNDVAGNRYGETGFDYELADSGQRAFDELGTQGYTEDVARGLTHDPTTGESYLDPESRAMLDQMFPDNPLSAQSLDQWQQELNQQNWQNRYIENTYDRNMAQLGQQNQDFIEHTYNNSWNGAPLSALDMYSEGGGLNLKDFIPNASTLAALTSLYRLLFPTSPEGGGGGAGGSVHAGGGAEAPLDMSELSGLLARSAGAGGGGQTGPQGGTGKGGGAGEGGMYDLMNLILNEMQKGGKYYFQT